MSTLPLKDDTVPKITAPPHPSATVKFEAEDLKTLRKKLKVFNLMKIHTTVLPILECTLVTISDSMATFGVTNLEIYAEYSIPIKPLKAHAATMFCVGFKEIWQFIYNAEEGMTMSYDDKKKRVTLSDGMFKVSMVAEEIENYPKRPCIETVLGFYAPDAKQIIPQMVSVLPWVSNDDLRPAMTGIYMNAYKNQIELVATDAHCLYRKQLPKFCDDVKKFTPFIMTSMFARVAISSFGSGDISIQHDGNRVSFSNDEYLITSRLIDSRYPDYGQVLSEAPHVFYVKRKQFKTFIKIARNFTNKSTGQVRFEIDGINLKADGGDIDFSMDFEYSVPVYQATPDIKYLFAANIRFIEKALAVGSDELIKIEHSASPTKAFYLDGVLMMPLIMNQ